VTSYKGSIGHGRVLFVFRSRQTCDTPNTILICCYYVGSKESQNLDLTSSLNLLVKLKILGCITLVWARGGAIGSDTELLAGRSRVRFPLGTLGFIYIILPAALWPWNSTS